MKYRWITSIADMKRRYEIAVRRFNPLSVTENGLVINHKTLNKLRDMGLTTEDIFGKEDE